MSPRDASSRRGQCCGKRTIEFLFYQHIGALVCTTTLAIAVWLVIRHAHLETWETAHGWATSYRQMIILTKMYPKIHQYAHDGSLSAGDRRLLLDDIRFESRNFTSEHDEVHARDRERFRQLTNADTDAIQAWITAVDAFIKKAETPRVWMSAVRPLADAAISPSVVDPCEQALVKVMNLYTEAMYSIGEMRYDLAGMVFLALLCVLSIGQMFLVRAEYTQQLATIQLAEELASVIHDVRTPQQVIVSAVALLTQPGTADTTNAHDMVQIIADSCTATQRLLDTALLRIRSRAAPEPVPLAAFFKDISSVQSAACRDKGILWRCDLAPSACVSVFVDSDALLQIVSNLVSNAIRYTSKGHVSLQVSVDAPEQRNVSWMQRLRSSKHLHTLVVSVSDTGCGIPKHAMPLVFRKFHQVKSGTGFGIGLFTVARLTSSLRGGIDLWSEVGKGTRIVVRVPVVLVPSSATSEGDDNALMAPEPSSPDDYPPSLTARSITALNIILLDDDPVTLKLSKRILANAGHSVRTFSHGETLLEQYDDADVIVTDLNMSGSMSGFQVADRLRAIGYRGALIAHTGDRFAYNACLEHGFDALLPKPSSASTYVATIESVHQHKCSCPSS